MTLPFCGPPLHLAVIVEFLGSVDDLHDESPEVRLHPGHEGSLVVPVGGGVVGGRT